MLSAYVFEKCSQKASAQHLLMILESFWDPFWSFFDPGGTLGRSLGPPWDAFGPRPEKVPTFVQGMTFLDLILNTFFHQVFFIFLCSFKLRFWEPCEPVFKGCWEHVETISGVVSQTFWRHWKLWKMQPLPCETTVFQYPEARFFIIFPRIFQDKF